MRPVRVRVVSLSVSLVSAAFWSLFWSTVWSLSTSSLRRVPAVCRSVSQSSIHVSNASARTFVCVFTYIQTYVKIFVHARSARTYRTVPVWSGSCSVRSPGRSVSACRLVVRAKTLQFTYQLGRCFLFVYYQLSIYIGSHVKISVLLVNPMQDPRFRTSCVREQLAGDVGK